MLFRSLVVKENLHERISQEIFDETFESLLDFLIECKPPTLRIAKTNFLDDISWETILVKIKTLLVDQATKLIICLGLVQTPILQDRIDIIRDVHEAPINGHKGVAKTYQRIRQDYFWPNMKKQVQNVIAECKICQLNKLVRKKVRQPMILTDTPGAAFDKVALDIVGPLPRTPKNNIYILTMQCLLTKFVVTAALRAANSCEVATAFLSNLVYIFGSPKILLTDQGTCFTSSLFKNIAKLCKVKACTTTAYRPQSNGSIERMHHVLKQYFKCYVRNENTWDEWLNYATFAYNTSVHESTKLTPFECVFGKIARVPSTRCPIEENVDETYAQYLDKLCEKLTETQRIARENLMHAKQKSKHYYDKRLNPCEFKVGDSVLLLKEPKRGPFGPEYTGPHKIINLLDNGKNVEITFKSGTRIVHPNKLRLTKLKNASETAQTIISGADPETSEERDEPTTAASEENDESTTATSDA